jgi:hypothetical protein
VSTPHAPTDIDVPVGEKSLKTMQQTRTLTLALSVVVNTPVDSQT